MRRIAKPGAVLALISYGVLRLDEDLNAHFQQFYGRAIGPCEIGPYWPA